MFQKVSLTIGYLFLGLLAGAHPAFASENLNALPDLVEKFLRQKLTVATSDRVVISVTTPDSRLRLNACEHPPKLTILNASTLLSGAISVSVSCNQPVKWQISVPCKITTYAVAAVLNHHLEKSQVISARDYLLMETDITHLKQVPLRTDAAVLGKIAQRALAKGTVLTQSMVADPILIRRGDHITLIVQDPALEIRVAGEALSDGHLGKTIRVKNLSSKRIMDAVVIEKGMALID